MPHPDARAVEERRPQVGPSRSASDEGASWVCLVVKQTFPSERNRAIGKALASEPLSAASRKKLEDKARHASVV